MHVLLIDDDIELTEMLINYLAGEGFKASAVHTGDAAVEAALSKRHSVVVLDIMMPGIDGLEVLRRIRQRSCVPIIMLSAKGNDMDRVVGLEMGADDYVPKPCNPRELVARLRAVLRRTVGQARETMARSFAFGPLRLLPAQRRVEYDGAVLELTVSEFNILECLMREADRVVTKDELSLKVLGRPRDPYDRSVDVHVSNLRQKLHAAMRGASVIETVRGVGYQMRQD
ncbi:MAG: response regulator transcription factor [Kiloniellales bacterium]|nr:response regulator transcription factor [Kiloniellales bacterium]